MTVVSVVKDAEALTLTITARFDAPIGRVWQVWSDPRRLERWWGPPTHPATVTEHDLAPGGTVAYVMVGPDADGSPTPDAPTSRVRVALSEPAGGGTHMEITTTWSSLEAMEQMLATGMEDGMADAVGQIDALLGLPGGA